MDEWTIIHLMCDPWFILGCGCVFWFFVILVFLRYVVQTRSLFNPVCNLSITNLSGKTVIITGGYTNVGITAAIEYIKLNARVIITCLNDLQGQFVISKIKQSLIKNQQTLSLGSSLDTNNVDYIVLDTSNIRSICEANIFKQFESKQITNIDYLILNDEIAAYKETTKYEISKVFITNYLGHFKFVHILLPMILKTAQQRGYNENYGAACRVVSVTSWMYRLCDSDILSILLSKHDRTAKERLNDRRNDISATTNNGLNNMVKSKIYTDFELFENRLRRLDKFALLFRKSIENKPQGHSIPFYCDDSDYSQSKLFLMLFMRHLNIKINQFTTMGNKNIVCCSADPGALIDHVHTDLIDKTNKNKNKSKAEKDMKDNDSNHNHSDSEGLGLVSFLYNNRFCSDEAIWVKIMRIVGMILRPFERIYLRKAEIGVRNILHATCNKDIRHGVCVVNCDQVDCEKFLWKNSNEFNVLKKENEIAAENLWIWSQKLVKFLS